MNDSSLVIRTNTLPDGMFAKVEGFNTGFEFSLTTNCKMDIKQAGGITDGFPFTFACTVIYEADYIHLIRHFKSDIDDYDPIMGLDRMITDDVLWDIVNIIFDRLGGPDDRIDDKYLNMTVSQLHDFFEDIHTRYPNSDLILARIS